MDCQDKPGENEKPDTQQQRTYLKVNTDPGLMELLQALPIMHQLTGSVSCFGGEYDSEPSYVFLLKNGQITVSLEKKDELMLDAEVAFPVMLYLMHLVSIRRMKTVEFDINDYLTFIGKKRTASSIDILLRGLRFLSEAEFQYRYTMRNTVYEGKGHAGYTVKRCVRQGKETDRKSIEVYVGWADVLIANLLSVDQFMLLDEEIPRLTGIARRVALKLCERYKNNRRKRNGVSEEVISVQAILKKVMGRSEAEISKHKGRYITQLEKAVGQIVQSGMFEIRYRGCPVTSREKYEDVLVFFPVDPQLIARVNQISRR